MPSSPDYEREKRWSDQILSGCLVGDVIWLEQANGHEFLALYTDAEKPRGAVIIGHGRGWNPDYELYGMLRVKLAEQGYTTLSIQLPVLGGGAKVGDYIPIYPNAEERYALAAKFLQDKGYKNIAIVSHSLGATMANQYLIHANYTPIKAWVFIGIINGLEEMFRIKIPVLDVFGGKDWEITQVGAYERKKQIQKVAGFGAGHGSRRASISSKAGKTIWSDRGRVPGQSIRRRQSGGDFVQVTDTWSQFRPASSRATPAPRIRRHSGRSGRSPAPNPPFTLRIRRKPA